MAVYKRGIKQFTDVKIKPREIPNALPEENPSETVSLEQPVSLESIEEAPAVAKKRGRPKKNLTHKEMFDRDSAIKEVKDGDVEVGHHTVMEKEYTEEEIEKAKKRSESHRKTRAQGRNFEEEIERGCSFYSDSGRAMISKVPENRRVVGRTGGRTSMMICVNDKKSHPDFMGSLAPDGKSIVFEAKHNNTDRIPFNRVTDYQFELLDKHYKMGASVFILIAFDKISGEKISFDFGDSIQAVYLVPFEIWRNMKALFGRLYLHINDFAPGKPNDLSQYRVSYIIDAENGKGIVYFLDPFVAE